MARRHTLRARLRLLLAAIANASTSCCAAAPTSSPCHPLRGVWVGCLAARRSARCAARAKAQQVLQQQHPLGACGRLQRPPTLLPPRLVRVRLARSDHDARLGVERCTARAVQMLRAEVQQLLPSIAHARGRRRRGVRLRPLLALAASGSCSSSSPPPPRRRHGCRHGCRGRSPPRGGLSRSFEESIARGFNRCAFLVGSLLPRRLPPPPSSSCTTCPHPPDRWGVGLLLNKPSQRATLRSGRASFR